MSTAALDGMLVVDVGTGVPGSYCARLLADFGADVISLVDLAEGSTEPLDGDADEAALATFLGQNKRSVALDTSDERGARLWRRLVERADVVVDAGDGSGESALARHGVDVDDLIGGESPTVVVSISPFGWEGPYRGRPATDLTVAALSGWLKTLGDPDRAPVAAGFPMIDYVSGVVAAVGTLAVARAVRHGAPGRRVDVSQQEVGNRLALYPSVAARLGMTPVRRLPFPMYVEASDGYAAVNALSAQHFRDACLYMGLDAEADDPAMAANEAWRTDAAPMLQGRMDEWAKDKTRDEIFEVGQAMRIPTAIPYTLLEVLEKEHYHERGFFRPLSVGGTTVQQPRGPLLSDLSRSEWREASRRGADTDEVLTQWLPDR